MFLPARAWANILHAARAGSAPNKAPIPVACCCPRLETAAQVAGHVVVCFCFVLRVADAVSYLHTKRDVLASSCMGEDLHANTRALSLWMFWSSEQPALAQKFHVDVIRFLPL